MEPSHPEPSRSETSHPETSPALSAETLRRILDYLDTGVRVVDLDGHLVYANREAERISEYQPVDGNNVIPRAQPLHDADGRLIGHVEFLNDPTEIFKLEQEIAALRRAAATDPLTGLANRRHLDSELNRQHALFQRTGTSYCVIYLDIDNFKHFNETIGHAVGDAALIGVARVLIEQCRPSDLVGRHGGDEFLILVPQITVQNAGNLAERLRAAVAAEETRAAPLAGKTGTGSGRLRPVPVPLFRRLTISLGVAGAREGETLPQLLDRADAALRRAKSSGRDQVVLAEG